MSAMKKCVGLMAIGLLALLVSAWLVTPAAATVLTMDFRNPPPGLPPPLNDYNGAYLPGVSLCGDFTYYGNRVMADELPTGADWVSTGYGPRHQSPSGLLLRR